MLPLLLLLPSWSTFSCAMVFNVFAHVGVCALCARSFLSKVRGISTRENCCTFHHHRHHPTSHLSPPK
uniref:Secreted protein n=1 Tax=Anopheles darlingi TaxID=43151 RepID=A0A2M4DPJ0_ANODA